MATTHRSVWPTFVWGLLAFCVFWLIAWMAVRYSRGFESYDESRRQPRLEKLAALREEEQQALNTYGWVNKEKGVVRLPVERAVQLAIADMKQKPVAKSNVKVQPVVGAVEPASIADPATSSDHVKDGPAVPAQGQPAPPVIGTRGEQPESGATAAPSPEQQGAVDAIQAGDADATRAGAASGTGGEPQATPQPGDAIAPAPSPEGQPAQPGEKP